MRSQAGGSAILDKTPPGPEDKIFKSNAKPGDDTDSALGPEYSEDNGIPNDIGKRLLQAAQLGMSFVNMCDTISPQLIPPQFVQFIQQFAEQAPAAAERMRSQNNPAALLAAVGNAGTQPGTPPVASMGAVGASRQGPTAGPTDPNQVPQQ